MGLSIPPSSVLRGVLAFWKAVERHRKGLWNRGQQMEVLAFWQSITPTGGPGVSRLASPHINSLICCKSRACVLVYSWACWEKMLYACTVLLLMDGGHAFFHPFHTEKKNYLHFFFLETPRKLPLPPSEILSPDSEARLALPLAPNFPLHIFLIALMISQWLFFSLPGAGVSSGPRPPIYLYNPSAI